MDGILRRARVPWAPESGQGGGGGGPLRPSRPLVPGIPTRVVDPSGVVKHRASGSDAPPRPDAEASTETRGELVVGRDIHFTGEIRACVRLVVHGEVEAVLPAQALHIGADGRFRGTADVEEAEIAGRFDGDLTVRGRLTVHAGGRIEGRARYGELNVEAGGQLAGDIDLLDADAEAQAAAADRTETPVGGGDARTGAHAPSQEAEPAAHAGEPEARAPHAATDGEDRPETGPEATEVAARARDGAGADVPAGASTVADQPAVAGADDPTPAHASEPAPASRSTEHPQPGAADSDEAARRRFKHAERARRLREYAESDL